MIAAQLPIDLKIQKADHVIWSESSLAALKTRPDYAITLRNVLVGFVEVKAPGKSADPRRYKGHDKDQWEKLQSLPNLLYTDGNSFSLWQNGELVGSIVELRGDVEIKRDTAHKAIDDYVAKGGTALYDALDLALSRLKSVDGRRVVVVLTDGYDENAKSTGPGSVTKWEQVLTSAKALDATIYAIGLGARVDKPRLRQLAELTGGEAYFTADVGQLGRHYRRIIEELHRRYVVMYTSSNPKRDGGWRKVELRSHLASVHVRSRGGYFAPLQ